MSVWIEIKNKQELQSSKKKELIPIHVYKAIEPYHYLLDNLKQVVDPMTE